MEGQGKGFVFRLGRVCAPIEDSDLSFGAKVDVRCLCSLRSLRLRGFVGLCEFVKFVSVAGCSLLKCCFEIHPADF